MHVARPAFVFLVALASCKATATGQVKFQAKRDNRTYVSIVPAMKAEAAE